MTEPSSKSRPQAFISSTVLDLLEHRVAAVDACLRVVVVPIVIEAWAAGDSDRLAQSRTILDQSDIYIWILAFSCRYIPPGRRKALTELEYERAVELGIPYLVFLMSDDHPVWVADVETRPSATQFQSFKAGIRKSSIVAEFRSVDKLKASMVTSLVGALRNLTRRHDPPADFLLLSFNRALEHLSRFIESNLLCEDRCIPFVFTLMVGSLSEQRWRSGARISSKMLAPTHVCRRLHAGDRLLASS